MRHRRQVDKLQKKAKASSSAAGPNIQAEHVFEESEKMLQKLFLEIILEEEASFATAASFAQVQQAVQTMSRLI